MSGAGAGRRAAAGAALVVVAAGLGWLAWHDRPGGRADRAPGNSEVSPFAAAGAPSASTPAGAAPATARVPGVEERQVCGGGWVRVGADGDVEGDVPREADVATLRAATIASLRADADELARAVGAWLGSDDAAALVDRALGTRDARVYALAVRTCRQRVDEPGSACSLLGPAQWARLDPGNAAPWIYALADAASRQDAAGVDEALFQIGASARNAMDLFQPVLPVLDALPRDDASLPTAFGVVSQALNRALASPVPPLHALNDACRGAALDDVNRRQSCERAADVLAERSDDLIDRAIGARLVTNLTGSSDRQARFRGELEAWTATQSGPVDVVDALSCRRIRASLDRFREQARYGEVGAIRRWVERSGLTSTELLERGRRVEAGRAAAVAAAAAIGRPEEAAASVPAGRGP